MDFLYGFAPRAASSEMLLDAAEPEASRSNKTDIPASMTWLLCQAEVVCVCYANSRKRGRA
jgi:hypothetical protein